MSITTKHGFKFEIDVGAANYRSDSGWTAGRAWADKMESWLKSQDFDTIAAIWGMDQLLGEAFTVIPETPVMRRFHVAQAAAAAKVTGDWVNPGSFEWPSICATPRLSE